jgi:hypothetical protein
MCISGENTDKHAIASALAFRPMAYGLYGVPYLFPFNTC